MSDASDFSFFWHDYETFGRVPRRNETIDIDGIRFQVLRADNRRLYTLLVSRLPPATNTDPE